MLVLRMCDSGCACSAVENFYYYLAGRSFNILNKSSISPMYVSIYCVLFVTKLASVLRF